MFRKLIKFFIKLSVWFTALTVLWVLAYRFIPVHYTPLMEIRAYSSDVTYDKKHEWKPIHEISQYLQLAVVCSEDQNFLKHNGFDYKAIRKAYKNNTQKKTLKGGSTISQQVAKNVFLWPERSWLRKGLEVYFTFLIEILWSKERILEVYLNSIEMGEGIYGAEAASVYWFNTSAKNLTKEQASSIAAILPNPLKYKANPPTKYIKNRVRWIQLQMQNYGTFSLEEIDDK